MGTQALRCLYQRLHLLKTLMLRLHVQDYN
jgi:hypothetical protein